MKLDLEPSLETKLLQALEVLPAAVVVYRTDGRLLYSNLRARKILARNDGLLPQRIDDALGFIPREEEGDELASSEVSVDSKGRPPLHLGYRARRLDPAEDGHDHLVLVFQDITEVAALRRDRDRLLHISSMSRLLPTIAHEILNPLAGIQSLLEVVSEQVHDPRLVEDLCTALDETSRLRLVVRGLGLAELELRGVDEAVDLVAVFEEVFGLFRRRAEHRGVEMDYCGDPVVRAKIHPDVIGLVLNHLLNNALEASRRGDRVEAALEWEEGRLKLVVSDTGVGMGAATLEQAADPFFTTKKGSSGIGLTLAKEVIERSGGSLDIVSHEGAGTRVTARFEPLGEG